MALASVTRIVRSLTQMLDTMRGRTVRLSCIAPADDNRTAQAGWHGICNVERVRAASSAWVLGVATPSLVNNQRMVRNGIEGARYGVGGPDAARGQDDPINLFHNEETMSKINEDQKRQATIKAEVSPEQGLLNLKFANGKAINLHLSELTHAILAMATLHGLKQKLVDAAAISRNPETGRSATVEDKYQAVMTVYERLMAGDWNAPREGGGNAGGLLFKALCRIYTTKTPESLREWLAGKSDKEQAALRANPKVAAVIADIQAEAGKTSGIDSEELLDELDADQS